MNHLNIQLYEMCVLKSRKLNNLSNSYPLSGIKFVLADDDYNLGSYTTCSKCPISRKDDIESSHETSKQLQFNFCYVYTAHTYKDI